VPRPRTTFRAVKRYHSIGENNCLIYKRLILPNPTKLEEHEAAIKAELLKWPHASGVARESRGR
jgi:hypothetical protein